MVVVTAFFALSGISEVKKKPQSAEPYASNGSPLLICFFYSLVDKKFPFDLHVAVYTMQY